MKNKNNIRGLGAALIDNESYLFLHNDSDVAHGGFVVRKGSDGTSYENLTTNAKILTINGPSDDLEKCSNFHVSKDGKMYYMTYRIPDTSLFCVAQSKNLIDWEKINELENHDGNGKIVSDYLYAGRNIMYVGGDAINLYVSEDFKKWSRIKKSVLAFEEKGSPVEIIDAHVVTDGVFVMYVQKEKQEGIEQTVLRGALFDYGDPTKLLWESASPIYVTQNTAEISAQLFGAVVYEDYFVSYWQENGDMFLLRHFYKSEDSDLYKEQEERDGDDENGDEGENEPQLLLERAPQNPILSPQRHFSWEAKAVYNPTAIEHDGKVHIIYRADGDDLMSVWGYAFTEDGVRIKKRLANHIYNRAFGTRKMPPPKPELYTSGNNSNGGCEDPRAVLIDDVVYVTFTAFDGWGSVRVGLTSIDLDDFIKGRWNWHDTRLISPPGEMNKNWVIFPEKINGKFAMLHSFVPEILIDYFDDLGELGNGNCIKSNNKRPVDESRGWDSWFRGVGPAPIKTDDGWLVIYHAMDHKNPDRYRIGALLLDLEDPTKEICRTQKPILEPEKTYENNGIKWGVIYCCGAVIKDDTLFVYYGGSDTYVCVATAPINEFLEDLKKTGEVKMEIK